MLDKLIKLIAITKIKIKFKLKNRKINNQIHTVVECYRKFDRLDKKYDLPTISNRKEDALRKLKLLLNEKNKNDIIIEKINKNQTL
jgi:hypothetical protein